MRQVGRFRFRTINDQFFVLEWLDDRGNPEQWNEIECTFSIEDDAHDLRYLMSRLIESKH